MVYARLFGVTGGTMLPTWWSSFHEEPSRPLPCVTEMPPDMQDLDKKDAVAEKQRESMMVGLSKTKTELGSLQDALARTQVELEKTNFELHAKKSKGISHIQSCFVACQSAHLQ